MSTVSSVASMKESGFKALIKRQPLLSMYIILFVLGWSGLILQVIDSQGVLSMPSPVAFIVQILTGWAPGIATVLITAVIAGRVGVRDLLRRFLIWRVGLQWYVVALFLIAAIILGGMGLHVLFGGAMLVIPAAGSSLVNAAIVLVVFIVLGVLLNTEEIAWRGFALPRLQARYGVLLAGLLLVIPEVGLHIPLFFDKTNPFFQTVGIYWFSAFSVAMVFVFIFVFNKTKGSLLIVTLMHASQNAWANLLSDDHMARPFQFSVALVWMIAFALIFFTKGQLGYEGESVDKVE
ncbi:MAG TPA: CPBP family glutamic-type intramembrane protease [Anaerolineales bacterium]